MVLPNPPSNVPILSEETGLPVNQWGAWFVEIHNKINTIQDNTEITDASASHAITDPADTPASADALRDDLVANTIPSIETALDALGAKINSVLDLLQAADIMD